MKLTKKIKKIFSKKPIEPLKAEMSLKDLLKLRERIDLNIERAKELEPLGDGKAVFLGDMTEDEREDYIKQVDRGWGGFYKKIKNL